MKQIAVFGLFVVISGGEVAPVSAQEAMVNCLTATAFCRDERMLVIPDQIFPPQPFKVMKHPADGYVQTIDPVEGKPCRFDIDEVGTQPTGMAGRSLPAPLPPPSAVGGMRGVERKVCPARK